MEIVPDEVKRGCRYERILQVFNGAYEACRETDGAPSSLAHVNVCGCSIHPEALLPWAEGGVRMCPSELKFLGGSSEGACVYSEEHGLWIRGSRREGKVKFCVRRHVVDHVGLSILEDARYQGKLRL